MERYNSINGLRTIACIGIVLMHVLANINYGLNNEIITNIIKSFTHFVYLFMIISAFSMCCGYYDKIKNNKISMNEFYKKRFTKILPFFSILIILNILMERNISAIFEGFADLTLLFGFLPVNKLSAIGVAWFLGVVFIFYIIFPFFVFLFDNKKRAWIVFVIALILNILCSKYFFTETFGLINYTNRHNFLYDFTYFCTGGLIYLYREKIKKLVSKNYSLVLIITFLFTISYFFIPENDYLFTIQMIIIFSLWIFTAMKENNILLNNKITSFISLNNCNCIDHYNFIFI